MSILLHGDCLEELKSLDDDSVDLVFCDLPYGQTSCKWDCKIDLSVFWKEIMRVKKLHTPLFFTTTTKFGLDLLNSAPKKCPFRYDLVWMKSAPAGFLSAKKMPMRKHEMIYVFYEKLPFYDLSSHKHKFLKDGSRSKKDNCYGVQKLDVKKQFEPPLPVSVLKEPERKVKEQNSNKGGLYSKIDRLEDVKYDPPLPVSVVKEDDVKDVIKGVNNTYNTEGRKKPLVREKGDKYDPPLPVSVVKEDEEVKPLCYGGNGGVGYTESYREIHGKKAWDPPLPVSIVKEPEPEHKWVNGETIYGSITTEDSKECGGHQKRYDPPLPVSVLHEENIQSGTIYGELPTTDSYATSVGINKADKHKGQYDPPLPVSVLHEPEPELCSFDVSKNVYGGGEAGRIKISKDKREHETRYDPPLPVSIVKEEEMRPTDTYKNESTIYGDIDRPDFKRKDGESMYDPPLPVSVVKEPPMTKEGIIYNGGQPLEINDYSSKGRKNGESAYDPPLPVSIVKENDTKYISNDNMYRGGKGKPLELNDYSSKGRKNGESAYEPPLPVSIVKEELTHSRKSLYGDFEIFEPKRKEGESRYEPKLPTSILPEQEPEPEPEIVYDRVSNSDLYGNVKRDDRENRIVYDPPLPHSMVEIKSTRGKHSTEKPVALMEWILKYYSKEGDVVLDPTMGSGSTGVACKNMNRNFIGIEMDDEIYEVAVGRVEG